MEFYGETGFCLADHPWECKGFKNVDESWTHCKFIGLGQSCDCDYKEEETFLEGACDE